MIYKRFLLSFVLTFKAALIFSQSLNGAYTIGGNSPNYATWKEAVTDLTSKGISGPVIFNVRAGTYNEQVTITQIPGSSAANTITFQSENKDSTSVKLSFSSNPSNPSTLLLNGADHLVFRNLTFQATNTTDAKTVTIQNDANDLLFFRNQFMGVNGSTSSSQALVYSSGLNDSLIFESNYFKSGSYGILTDVSSSGNTGVKIKGNTFSNQYYRSVYLNYANSPLVTENKVISEGSYSNFEGMCFSNLIGEAQITGNTITALKGTGMTFSGRSGSSGKYSLVSNNTVSIGSSTNGDIGIYFSSATYYSFYHNTINIYSQSTSAYALYLYYSSNLTLFNNIFANTGTGLALYSIILEAG
jgi:hypothetical protein